MSFGILSPEILAIINKTVEDGSGTCFHCGKPIEKTADSTSWKDWGIFRTNDGLLCTVHTTCSIMLRELEEAAANTQAQAQAN